MDALLAALAASDAAAYMRTSRWGYAGLNAAHILGLATLVGAILPLDLRLLGLWPTVPHVILSRVLVPVAACGLALAIVTGTVLFATRAPDYAALGIFQAKLALVALGTGSAVVAHLRLGWRLQRATPGRMRLIAVVSLASWLGALLLGRLIGFAE